MLKQLRSVKRCLIDPTNPTLRANVSVCPPFQHSNPYRKTSEKYEQFENIKVCLQSNPIQDISALTIKGIRASELWKEARLGHIQIQIQYQDAPKSIPVIDYFDNIRNQWTQLQCFDTQCFDTDNHKTLLHTFHYNAHSNITIYDICCAIEEQCVQYTPFKEDDDTWSFLLYDSQNLLLNQNNTMHTKWWSKKSFLHHSHDFSNIVSILVSPNMLDKDTQYDMDIVGNRVGNRVGNQKDKIKSNPDNLPTTHSPSHSPTPILPENKPLTTTEMIEQQNKAYYASLSIDQLKNQEHNTTESIVSNPIEDKNTIKINKEVIQDTQQPLTREELCNARLQFFLRER